MVACEVTILAPKGVRSSWTRSSWERRKLGRRKVLHLQEQGEVRKEMGIGRTGKSLTYIEEGGVDGERTRATAEFEIGKGKR